MKGSKLTELKTATGVGEKAMLVEELRRLEKVLATLGVDGYTQGHAMAIQEQCYRVCMALFPVLVCLFFFSMYQFIGYAESHPENLRSRLLSTLAGDGEP